MHPGAAIPPQDVTHSRSAFLLGDKVFSETRVQRVMKSLGMVPALNGNKLRGHDALLHRAENQFLSKMSQYIKIWKSIFEFITFLKSLGLRTSVLPG